MVCLCQSDIVEEPDDWKAKRKEKVENLNLKRDVCYEQLDK